MIAKCQTVTITVPIPFLGEIHSEICEGELRDAIGYLYFQEKFPTDLKELLRAQGYDPEQFIIRK